MGTPSAWRGDRADMTPPAQPMPSPGGSFLGTAAAAAVGVIGGALLLDGIRSAFGHHTPGAGTGSPWGGGELSRQAGFDDIGRDRAGAFDADQSQATLADLQDVDDDDSDAGDDFDIGGDTDVA